MLDAGPGIAEALVAARGGGRRGLPPGSAARGLLGTSAPALHESGRDPTPPGLAPALREIDPLLGELFAALWRSGAPEPIAIRLAVALSADAGGAPAWLHEALVAVALFGIADALFARVDDSAGDADAWTPHLLAADCALAECLGALARLPGPAAESLADAFVRAAGARLDGTRGSPAQRPFAERALERAWPARVLAGLAAVPGSDGPFGGTAPLAAWIGATAFALAEADGPQGARAREFLAAQLAAYPGTPGDARALRALAGRVHTGARMAVAAKGAAR